MKFIRPADKRPGLNIIQTPGISKKPSKSYANHYSSKRISVHLLNIIGVKCYLCAQNLRFERVRFDLYYNLIVPSVNDTLPET